MSGPPVLADIDLPPPPAVPGIAEIQRERPPSLPPPPEFDGTLAAEGQPHVEVVVADVPPPVVSVNTPVALPRGSRSSQHANLGPAPSMAAPARPNAQAPTPAARAAPAPAPAAAAATLSPPPSMAAVGNMKKYASVSRATSALHAASVQADMAAGASGQYAQCTQCTLTEYPLSTVYLAFLGEDNPREICCSCVDTLRARKARTITAEASSNTPLIDGWLEKRKARGARGKKAALGGWKKRYCVLIKSGALHYYKNDDRRDELGTLFVPQMRRLSWAPKYQTLLIEMADDTLYEFRRPSKSPPDLEIVYWYKNLKLLKNVTAPTLFEGWLFTQKLIGDKKDRKKRRWCKLNEFDLEFYSERDDPPGMIMGEAELIGASPLETYQDAGETVIVLKTLRLGTHYLTLCEGSAQLAVWQSHLTRGIQSLRSQ